MIEGRLTTTKARDPSPGSPQETAKDGSPASVTVVHYADPFCWWSWGLEPVLQRLQEVYGENLTVEYRMGGVFADIATWRKHYGVDEHTAVDWTRESAELTKNPLDFDYMRKTGVRNTYPACLAFKAAQLQSATKAAEFLRRMLVAFQVECQPSTAATLLRLGEEVGLDAERLKKDARSEKVRLAFEEDRAAMERAQASFLTLMVAAGGQREATTQVFTSGPIESIIDRLVPGLPKREPADILQYLEGHRGLTTAHEIAEVFRITDADAAERLAALAKAGLVTRATFAETSYWAMGGTQTEQLPLDAVRISHVPPSSLVTSEVDLTPIITTAVQNLYTQVAREPTRAYHFPLGMEALRFVGYPEQELREIPSTATESFAGVGYPFVTESIRPGDTVIDIGSGSGTDVLYAAHATGPTGRVYGIDVTPAMIEKARANIVRAGAKHAEILTGNATSIPSPDSSIDVVTSNGVLNLVPDKPAAFREIYRVLKPGGRLQLADIVTKESVGAVCGLSPQLWADCIGGASVEDEYLRTIREAGFEDLKVVKRVDYFAQSASLSTRRITKTFGATSIVLSARRPA